MEQNREKNFVCKFCSKRFACGKSLGGHIRTHMNENSADSDEEEDTKFFLSNSNGGCGQTSYGLRENPKKSKKFVDQSVMGLKQQLICRECGKGFHSLKALCGHMACHSEREKVAMDSESDTETFSAPSRRSKKVMKLQNEITGNQSNSSPHSYSNSYSPSESEIEQEQEELANCLMMLSRDSCFKNGNNNHNQNPFAELSDTNSVILETRSSSIDVRINKKNQGKCGYNANQVMGTKGLREDNQIKSVEDNGFLASDSDNSDSGYFENGPKKGNSDESFDRFLKNSEFSKPKVEIGSRPGKIMNIYKDGAKFEKQSINDLAKRASAKYDLRKSPRIMSYNPQKRSKYEIRTKEFNETVYESGENSLGADDSCAETKPGRIKIQPRASSSQKKQIHKKKNKKGHECPLCSRVFRSGQALGGHKRSHFLPNREISHEQAADRRGLFDLNLPPPVE